MIQVHFQESVEQWNFSTWALGYRHFQALKRKTYELKVSQNFKYSLYQSSNLAKISFQQVKSSYDQRKCNFSKKKCLFKALACQLAMVVIKQKVLRIMFYQVIKDKKVGVHLMCTQRLAMTRISAHFFFISHWATATGVRHKGFLGCVPGSYGPNSRCALLAMTRLT